MELLTVRLGLIQRYFFNRQLNKLLRKEPSFRQLFKHAIEATRAQEIAYVRKAVTAVHPEGDFMKNKISKGLVRGYYFGLVKYHLLVALACTALRQEKPDSHAAPKGDLGQFLNANRIPVLAKCYQLEEEGELFSPLVQQVIYQIVDLHFLAASQIHKQPYSVELELPIRMYEELSAAAKEDVYAFVAAVKGHSIGLVLREQLAVFQEYERQR